MMIKDLNEPNTPGNVSRAILMRHLNSFLEHDLRTLMSDYTEESVMVTQEGTYTGLTEIERFFTDLMVYFPKLQSSFELDKTVIVDELLLIVWHARTPRLVVPLASDTFRLKEGKISRQTFVGELNFVS
jgi:hypothetical protein